MSAELLQDLVIIANAIDESGFMKEAAELDELIKKKREDIEQQSKLYQHIGNPTEVDKGLLDMLKRLFSAAVADNNKPSITSVSLKDIYTVLDEATRNSAMSPASNLETSEQPEQSFVSPQARSLAENLAALEVDLAKMRNEILDPGMEALEKRNLERNIQKYQGDIQVNNALLEELKTKSPKDYEQARRYIDEKKRNTAPGTHMKTDLRQTSDRRDTGEQ